MLDGFEYCGNHSKCVNNDDDTRGLACECDTGYTEHRIYFGMAIIPCSAGPVPLFTLPKMFYNQVVETWMNVLKEDTNVERTLIASTLMVAIIVSAKLALKEIHVRHIVMVPRIG